jgi:hypothetical protein
MKPNDSLPKTLAEVAYGGFSFSPQSERQNRPNWDERTEIGILNKMMENHQYITFSFGMSSIDGMQYMYGSSRFYRNVGVPATNWAITQMMNYLLGQNFEPIVLVQEQDEEQARWDNQANERIFRFLVKNSKQPAFDPLYHYDDVIRCRYSFGKRGGVCLSIPKSEANLTIVKDVYGIEDERIREDELEINQPEADVAEGIKKEIV